MGTRPSCAEGPTGPRAAGPRLGVHSSLAVRESSVATLSWALGSKDDNSVCEVPCWSLPRRCGTAR